MVSCRESGFIRKKCVLDVEVSFLSLISSSLDDTFIISAGAADQFVRVLWTTSGVHEMGVRLGVLADPAFHLEMEDRILKPFYQLRGIRILTTNGFINKELEQDLISKMMTPHCGHIILEVLKSKFDPALEHLRSVQKFSREQRQQ